MAKAEQEAAATGAVRLTDAKKLKSAIAAGRANYKEQRSIAGAFGEKVAQLVEYDHLHKKAFGMIRALDRLEPEKLAEWRYHFDYYFEASGLKDRADSVPRLAMADDGEKPGPQGPAKKRGAGKGRAKKTSTKKTDDKGEKAGGDKSNVRPFPSPMGVAAE